MTNGGSKVQWHLWAFNAGWLYYQLCGPVRGIALSIVMVLAKKLGQDSYFQGASSAYFICGTFMGEFPDQ